MPAGGERLRRARADGLIVPPAVASHIEAVRLLGKLALLGCGEAYWLLISSPTKVMSVLASRSRCALADRPALRGPCFWLVEHRDRANMAANLVPDIPRAELIARAGFAHDRNAVTIP
jgi:hypothetical protein